MPAPKAGLIEGRLKLLAECLVPLFGVFSEKSLARCSRDGRVRPRETERERERSFSSRDAQVVGDAPKLVGKTMLFDVFADPSEASDLADERPADVARLAASARRRIRIFQRETTRLERRSRERGLVLGAACATGTTPWTGTTPGPRRRLCWSSRAASRRRTSTGRRGKAEPHGVSTHGIDRGFYVWCLRVVVDECRGEVTMESALESRVTVASTLERSIVTVVGGSRSPLFYSRNSRDDGARSLPPPRRARLGGLRFLRLCQLHPGPAHRQSGLRVLGALARRGVPQKASLEESKRHILAMNRLSRRCFTPPGTPC